MSEIKEIINNLKKAVYDIRIEVRETLFFGYKRKEINLQYRVKNSLLNKENKESRNRNYFCYSASPIITMYCNSLLFFIEK